MGRAAAQFVLEASRGRRVFFLVVAPLLLAMMIFSSAKGGAVTGTWDGPYDLLAYVTAFMLVASAIVPWSMLVRLLAASLAVATWISRLIFYTFDAPQSGWPRIYALTAICWFIVSTVAWAFAADLTLMVVTSASTPAAGTTKADK